MIVLGIDPGWASCGISIKTDGGTEYSSNFVPRDVAKESTIDAVEAIVEKLQAEWDMDFLPTYVKQLYMERYVAYKGIHSDMSEFILMYIGGIKTFFEWHGVSVEMVRAIDWKPKVCKYLMRTQGFKNPSTSFDKKFSIAAAKTLSGKDITSDHAADAVCLSYLYEIEQWNIENKK